MRMRSVDLSVPTWGVRAIRLLAIFGMAVALPVEARSIDAAGLEFDGLYRGTLAHQRIVLEVQQVGDKIRGRYFYPRHGHAIRFAGMRLADGSFRLREYQGERPNGAEWRLKVSGDLAKGAFCRCDLRRRAEPGTVGQQPISLTLAPGDVTYDDLLLDFPLRQGPIITVNRKIAYAMREDTRFHAVMPYLLRFPDHQIREKVNADLEARLRQNRLSLASPFQTFEGGNVDGDGGYPERWEVRESVHVGLVSAGILSLVMVAEWHRRGDALPSLSTTALTYNLRNGEPFDFGDFFRKPEDFDLENNHGKEEETAVFAEDQRDLQLLKLYLRHYKTPAGCSDGKAGREEARRAFRPILHFERDGLSIAYEIPYAIRSCGEVITVPFRELKGLVRKGIIQ